MPNNTPAERKVISLADLSRFKELFTAEFNNSFIPYYGATSSINIGKHDFITESTYKSGMLGNEGYFETRTIYENDGQVEIHSYTRYRDHSVVIEDDTAMNSKTINFPSASELGNTNTFATREWANTQLADYLPLSGGTITGNNPIFFNNAYSSIRDRAQSGSISGGLQLEGDNIFLKTDGGIDFEMETKLSFIAERDNNTRYNKIESAGDIILSPGTNRKLYYGSIDSDGNNEIAKKGDFSGYATEDWVNGVVAGYLPLSGGNLTGSLNVGDDTNDPTTVHRHIKLTSPLGIQGDAYVNITTYDTQSENHNYPHAKVVVSGSDGTTEYQENGIKRGNFVFSFPTLTADATLATQSWVNGVLPTESTVSGWGFTKNVGTVTSVSASGGLTITGTASVNPTVTVASGYKLPTTSEWNSKANASALDDYLPLSAGINNPLKGDLYLETTAKGVNLGVYVKSPATPNRPESDQPYQTFLKSSEAVLLTYFNLDGLGNGSWRSRLELHSTRNDKNNNLISTYYESKFIEFIDTYSNSNSRLVFPDLSNGDIYTIATEEWVQLYTSPAYNGALSLQVNGVTKTTFYANDSTDRTFNITAADFGISGAMTFLGVTTTALSDGSATQTITVNGNSVTAVSGNVALYGHKEFVWTGSSWEELGDESSFALKTVSITGTGVLSGGGTLEGSSTITHNQVNTSGAQATSAVYKTTIDVYGHITSASAASYGDVGALGASQQAVDSAKLGGQLPSYYATAASLNGYVAKTGDTMSGNLDFTSGSHIQLSTSNSNSVGNYVSAGGGYSYNSGKYGVKIVACDQGDCISGLGQDLNPNGYPYDLCIVGSNSGGDVGHISFVTHKDGNWTTYREIANFYDNAGNVTFTVNGNVQINGGIRSLAINDGIYWNPYVESSSDGSDAASITVLSNGAAGGTELRISQANDSNDIINLVSPYYIYMNNKRAFTINDSWLRINESPSAGFSDGIYCGGSIVRTDNQLQVGSSGTNFYANSSGNTYSSNEVKTPHVVVSSGTTTKVTMQYNTSEDCLDFIFS